MTDIVCQSCKKRPATMLSRVLVDGEQRNLRLCGLCAHRLSMKQAWLKNPYGGTPEGMHFTGDLWGPVPPGADTLVFTSITKRGQDVLEWAERESTNFGMGSIASTAVLIGLLTDEAAASYQILKEMGVDLDSAFVALHEALSKKLDATRPEVLDTRLLLRRAQDIAASFHDPLVEPEHIMLSLLDHRKSLAVEILLRLGVNVKELKARLFYYLECQRIERDMSADRPVFEHNGQVQEALNKPGPGGLLQYFSRDLILAAKQDSENVVAGREELLERVISVLCLHRRNNPLMVGEAGVGKAFVIEALAQRVVKGDVPAMLKDVRIAELDAVALVAGASMQGEIEQRIMRVLEEMSSHPEGFILYIPYAHTMLGEEARASGISLTSLLQPILDRPRVWCIAATTFKHFENLVAPDENLTSFFQKIVVDELPPEDTVRLLQALRPRYEKFHGVNIGDDALEAAVNLSSRYLTDICLPEKAIDLVDEAAARLSMGKKEGDAGSQEVVDAEDVAEVITVATGIPASRLLKEEAERLLQMEEELARRIVGQEDAVRVVAETIKRSRSGLADQKKPVGSFFFLGPTGVGKTELARSLAMFLFGDDKAMVRLDMSEFSEKHSVSRLIGSPPGYIGYEEGGQLTSAVEHRPYSVVLLDEIEKAHPVVFNLLLQLLDEGRLTDSRGKTVNFRNTVIIMTSNIASELIGDIQAGLTGGNGESIELEGMVLEKLKERFPIEFINRIDEIVVFDPLSPEKIERIVDLKVTYLLESLGRKGIALRLLEPARALLARHGYSRDFGARFLQRAIQKELANPLSDLLLKGEAGRGQTVEVDASASGDSLAFRVTGAASTVEKEE